MSVDGVVLALISRLMTGDLLKVSSNWVGLTRAEEDAGHGEWRQDV